MMLFRNNSMAALFLKLLNPRLKIAFNIGIEQDSYEKLPYFKFLVYISLIAKTSIAHFLYVNTQQGYNSSIAFAPFLKKKLKIIREGIPERYFLKKGEGKHRKKIVLCVARLTPNKQQEVLIRAFASIHNKHKDWKLKLVGWDQDGDYAIYLANLSDKLGIWWEGMHPLPMDDIALRKEYLNASIFCLPSLQEQPGTARTEAMAMGLPVVTTRTNGSEFVEGSGIIVPIGDEKALAKGLDKFMSSANARDEASKREREDVEQFRAIKVAKELLDYIKSC